MTEEEKMLAGERYDALDKSLLDKLDVNRLRVQRYNSLDAADATAMESLAHEIVGRIGVQPVIRQPFRCDYGSHIIIGDRFFSNFNLTILDEAWVRIGDDVFIGPNVGIYTPCHPIDAKERNKGTEWAKPVNIGNSVWIGGGVTICPGVTIGDDCVIGAGSVVVHDIPPHSVAVGNPARVIKSTLKAD